MSHHWRKLEQYSPLDWIDIPGGIGLVIIFGAAFFLTCAWPYIIR